MRKDLEDWVTLELKSVQRFLSFSRSSSNSFNLATFLSFFRRFSSRRRCSNSRLKEINRIFHLSYLRMFTLSSLDLQQFWFHSYPNVFDRMVLILIPKRQKNPNRIFFFTIPFYTYTNDSHWSGFKSIKYNCTSPIIEYIIDCTFIISIQMKINPWQKQIKTYFPSSFHGAKHRSPVFHLIPVRVFDDAALLFDWDDEA